MDTILSVASGGGKLVAVGNNGAIRVSDDNGATWFSRTSPTTNHLYCVTYGETSVLTGWVAAGEAGVILSSPDGDNWGIEASIGSGDWYGLSFNQTCFMVGAAGAFAISVNFGFSWLIISTGTVEDLYSIYVGPSEYLIVGANDTVIIGFISTLEDELFISNTLQVTDIVTTTGSFQHDASEDIECVGHTGEFLYEWLSDGVSTDDLYSTNLGVFNHRPEESVGFLQTFISALDADGSVLEALTLYDWPAFFYGVLSAVSESIATSDSSEFYYLILPSVRERMSTSASTSSVGTFNHVFTQGLTTKDKTALSWEKLVSETLTLDPAALSDLQIVRSIIEQARVADQTASFGEILAAISLTIAFQEAIQAGKGAEVLESPELVASIFDRAIYKSAQLEQLIMAATPDMTLVLSLPVTETATISDTLSIGQILEQLVAEGIVFNLSFGMDNETYTGWVMNTNNFAVSEYDNYPFNSFAKIGDTYYGANNNGLYSLDGDDDDGTPINATFTTGACSFADRSSRVSTAFLALRSGGNMLLKTITDDDVERWYELANVDWTLRDRRVILARGITSRYWQFTITNVDGVDFELDELALVPIILKRR